MNIKDSVSRLTQQQKEALRHILICLQDKKRLGQKDVGLLGFSIDNCRQAFILKVFDITKMTIGVWEKNGCPRNKDGSYNLTEVITWKMKDVKAKSSPVGDLKRDAEIKRLHAQIDKLELDVSERRGEVINAEKVRSIAAKQAIELRTFWTDGWKRNLPKLLKALKVSTRRSGEVMSVIDGFIEQAMNAFIQSGKEID